MTNIINAKTRLLGLLADPSEHSKSPDMYNSIFPVHDLNYVYMSFQVNPETLANAVMGIRALNFVGANVSMPNKVEVLQYLDEVDPVASVIGAVNCITNKNGILKGYNTDGLGFVSNLKEHGVDVTNKTITLVGVGGAGTAVAAQSAFSGAKAINIFNIKDSSFERAQKFVQNVTHETGIPVQLFDLADEQALANSIEQSEILINATAVGMGRFEGQSVVKDVKLLRSDLIVADTIYDPEKTQLLVDAENAGCQIINGQGMLKNQGIENFKLWTGLPMYKESK